jgi:hypothetical protein
VEGAGGAAGRLQGCARARAAAVAGVVREARAPLGGGCTWAAAGLPQAAARPAAAAPSPPVRSPRPPPPPPHAHSQVLGPPACPACPAGHLLEIASVITGLGIIIHEGTIRSSSEVQEPGLDPALAQAAEGTAGAAAAEQHDFSAGRLFRLWVSSGRGRCLPCLQRAKRALRPAAPRGHSLAVCRTAAPA